MTELGFWGNLLFLGAGQASRVSAWLLFSEVWIVAACWLWLCLFGFWGSLRELF